MGKVNAQLNTFDLPGVAKSVTGVDVLNSIRAVASPEYQNRIPEATRDNMLVMQ